MIYKNSNKLQIIKISIHKIEKKWTYWQIKTKQFMFWNSMFLQIPIIDKILSVFKKILFFCII